MSFQPQSTYQYPESFTTFPAAFRQPSNFPSQTNPYQTNPYGPAPPQNRPPPPQKPAEKLVAVADCVGCKAGLSFDPPARGAEKPRRVRCPICKTDNVYEKCWTCPAVIPFGSTCRACFERDTSVPDPMLVAPGHHLTTPSSLQRPAPPISPREVSSSPVLSEDKGLSNRAGENNCFLNVTIQSLWHLKPFRDYFESQTVSHKPDCHCVHCALAIILANYRYAATNTLAPDVLRRSLDLLYAAESKFKLGELSDATECFDAICCCLHDVAVNGKSMDTLCFPLCSAHASFQLLIEERLQCKKCGEKISDVQSMFLHYVYASEIVNRCNKMTLVSSKKTFEQILKKLNVVEPRACTKCQTLSSVDRIILKPFPKIFGVAIAWADANPSMADVSTLLNCIDPEINLCSVFEPPDIRERGRQWRLRGMICYYLKHYAAYFFSDKKNVWISFDDVSVQEVGPTWKDVVRKCKMGHSKPTVVFFEEVASAVNIPHDNTPSPITTRNVKHRSIRERMKIFQNSNNK